MKRIHILLLIVVAVLTAFIVSTYSDSSTYGTFEEAEEHNSTMHIIGKYDRDKKTEYDPIKDPNYFTFFMEDKVGNTIQVKYPGPKPIDFERSEQIVVVGKMVNHQFEASKILLKCPSKYNEENI